MISQRNWLTFSQPYNTLIGVTKRDPLMLESVTWLSSTAVIISSAPVIIAMSRLMWADSWKSVWFQ